MYPFAWGPASAFCNYGWHASASVRRSQHPRSTPSERNRKTLLPSGSIVDIAFSQHGSLDYVRQQELLGSADCD